MNKKENQRTRLTKMLVKDGLIALLQKKTIYQISVTELCEAAELNRSTTLQRSKQCMQEIAVGEEAFQIEPLYRLLCHMQNNCEIYKLLLNNSVDDSFPSDMIQETIEFLRNTAKSLNIKEDDTSDYRFQYLISGCISVVQNWINSEMKESPMEISKLIYHTSVAVLKSTIDE